MIWFYDIVVLSVAFKWVWINLVFTLVDFLFADIKTAEKDCSREQISNLQLL